MNEIFTSTIDLKIQNRGSIFLTFQIIDTHFNIVEFKNQLRDSKLQQNNKPNRS